MAERRYENVREETLLTRPRAVGQATGSAGGLLIALYDRSVLLPPFFLSHPFVRRWLREEAHVGTRKKTPTDGKSSLILTEPTI